MAKKNLIKSRDEYTRYYGDFRGVDFSSEHSQVHPQRLAYLVNMYKDYRSGEGGSLETIPGFRRAVKIPDITQANASVPRKINGLHEFNYTEDGVRKTEVLIHAGTNLYPWGGFPTSANIGKKRYVQIPSDLGGKDCRIAFADIGITVKSVWSITSEYGTAYTSASNTYTYSSAALVLYPRTFASGENEGKSIWGSVICIEYVEGVLGSRLNGADFADAPSVSFQFNNYLYILDGANYWRVKREDGETSVSETFAVYTPTTYKDIDVGGTEPIETYRYEQLNRLTTSFKHTYIADGSTKKYYLYTPFASVSSVKINNVDTKDYSVSTDGGYVEFTEAAPAASASVEIVATVADSEGSRITKCTIATIFDKRVFLSGNPNYPNDIYFCGINNETGYEDATYFGELDYIRDGVESAPITAMIPVADTLAVLKNHSKQDGSVYFHSRHETTANYAPVTYPAVQGLSGVGCLGAAVNFRDDPCFISSQGVEAIGQLSVRLERGVEHRSSLIDSKLCNLDLTKAKMREWDGYLIVLCDGKIFMADSRQAYTHESGTVQYEWYYLEGIGVYEGQTNEYYFSADIPTGFAETIEGYEVSLASAVYDPMRGGNTYLISSPVPQGVTTIAHSSGYRYALLPSLENGALVTKAILCEDRGSYTGGTFYPATCIVNIGGNLYFGTDSGVVCAFNFDKREADGMLAPQWYSFDERTIYSGCATKMDNCDIPHLAKSTIKKSTVVKTKPLRSSAAKIKVRTNKNSYKQIARINTREFSFDSIDFSDFSFASSESIHAVKEKEKHWVEKQQFIYTDEYQKPLAIQYIAFRYKIAGRVKG